MYFDKVLGLRSHLDNCHVGRDVVLTNMVWERTQETAILKQLQIHFRAKREKDVGMPFPPHYTPASRTTAT